MEDAEYDKLTFINPILTVLPTLDGVAYIRTADGRERWVLIGEDGTPGAEVADTAVPERAIELVRGRLERHARMMATRGA